MKWGTFRHMKTFPRDWIWSGWTWRFHIQISYFSGKYGKDISKR